MHNWAFWILIRISYQYLVDNTAWYILMKSLWWRIFHPDEGIWRRICRYCAWKEHIEASQFVIYNNRNHYQPKTLTDLDEVYQGEYLVRVISRTTTQYFVSNFLSAYLPVVEKMKDPEGLATFTGQDPGTHQNRSNPSSVIKKDNFMYWWIKYE